METFIWSIKEWLCPECGQPRALWSPLQKGPQRENLGQSPYFAAEAR
jgi:hypothetical protein